MIETPCNQDVLIQTTPQVHETYARPAATMPKTALCFLPLHSCFGALEIATLSPLFLDCTSTTNFAAVYRRATTNYSQMLSTDVGTLRMLE